MIFNEGGKVEEAMTLLSVDLSPMRTALDESEAAVAKARAGI